MRPAPRPTARRATATVEFAVVGPVFLMMVLGIIEVGRGLMVAEQVQNAAYRGARLASSSGTKCSDIKTTVDSAMKSMLLTDSSGTSLARVQVYDNGTLVYDSSTGTGASSTLTSGDTIQVKVRVQVSKITWVPSGLVLNSTNTNDIVGQATLVAE